MGGASSFYAMLAICGFLSAAWSATKISKLIGISSIVLEITTGVVLGPRVLGLIDDEYAQCEHQRHADCQPPADLYHRIEHSLKLGPTMGRIANMEYCDLHSYLEKEGRLHLVDPYHHGNGGHGGDGNTSHGGGGAPHGHGAGEDHSNHEDPCGDGAHLAGHFTWNASLGNGSVARYHCQGGTLVREEVLPEEEAKQGLDHPTTVVTSTSAVADATTTTAAVSMGTTTGMALAATTGSPAGEQATTGGSLWDAEDLLNTTLDEANATDEDEDSDGARVQSAGSTASPAPGSPGGRRLSGGGGGEAKYDTYAQCLERSCEADVSHHCSLTPDVFTLIGHAGVALMIFESGMHFDFAKARQVGLPACVVAVVGTILPLIAGSLLVMAFGKQFVPDGISAGTALAPTSVGISLRLLGEAGVLQENFGQAIITAAFVDDILSLVLFNILFSLGGDFHVFSTVISPIIGIAFMLVAMYAAVKFWPWAIEQKLLPMVPDERDELASGLGRIRLTKDEVLFLGMMAVLVVYALITHLLGTHLWGCFMAGMSFACLQPVGHAHHVWVTQTKRITTWMVRIFFACTVAFSIPVADLMSFNAFWKGTLMGIGPCILTKVSCAFFMGPPRFVIGWAMVGRAEFAYLIAQMAAAASMIDEETFSICIWALLYATIFAPFVFRYLLNNYIKEYGLGEKGGVDMESPVEDCGEGHGQEERPKKDFDGEGARLRDLEGIDFAVSGDEDLKKTGAPRSEVMGSHPVESDADETYGTPAESAFKPRGGVRVRKGPDARDQVFRGSRPNGRGYLCCLLFRRIVEH
uniref:Cation/H+ exchanger transmembrane domain-containing protein n=1 Tax=Alexandrium andersonii TaxID=327968 RepID=A0A7S2JCM2_9DINO